MVRTRSLPGDGSQPYSRRARSPLRALHNVREGKEPGIKPLISKMLDVYRSMMIYDWRFPGEYYCGISRIAFVNVELLNILIQQIPREKWHEIGIKIGDALKVKNSRRDERHSAHPA